MITYDGTIDTGSLTLRDACTDETNNLCIIVESGTNTLRAFNLSSLTQSGSNLSVTAAPYAVMMLNSASAIVAGSSTTLDLVQMPNLYRTTHTGSLGLSTVTRTQRIAVDTANSTAMIAPSTNKTLVRFVGSTATVTQITLDMPAQDNIQSIIFIGNSRYICSTSTGHLYEIDSTGKIYKKATIDRMPTNTRGTNLASLTRVISGFMTYYDGFLYVSTTGSTSSGFTTILDWTTGTIINQFPTMDSNTGVIVSNSASGHFLSARSADTVNASIHQVVYDNNMIAYGFNTDSTLFTGSAGSIVNMGINTANSKGWALQEVIDDIRVFTISASSLTTTRTVSSPNNVDFRLIMLDMTDGQGSVKRYLDTYTTSPRTLTVPTGRTFIEIIKIGTGSDATWDVSKYNT